MLNPPPAWPNRMLPGQNQALNTLTPELAQYRAGSAQKVPPRSCSKPPWWCRILSGEVWKTQEGGIGNTLDCKAEGRQPGLAHCFWPWSIPLSPGNPFHTHRRRPSAAKEQGSSFGMETTSTRETRSKQDRGKQDSCASSSS